MSLEEIINAAYSVAECEPEKYDTINWSLLSKLEEIKFTGFDCRAELPDVISNLIIEKLIVQED